MEKSKKKSQGFYPTPRKLATKLLEEHFEKIEEIPTSILEPSAGEGDFVIQAWNIAITKLDLSKKEIEKMVSTTYLFENEKVIYSKLKKVISHWCEQLQVKSRPNIINDNFLINHNKYSIAYGKRPLVIGNPPWDEFTARKHDSSTDLDSIRMERNIEKEKYKNYGYKNVYQCFLHEILQINSQELNLIFVLPRQLLGDLSSFSIREAFTIQGSLKLTVYANKDYPDFYFEAVARTAEILCLRFSRGIQKTIEIRRGFTDKYSKISTFGEDLTIPCPFDSGSSKTLLRILNFTKLDKWSEEYNITVKRGNVTYTNPNYKRAIGGRNFSAYQIQDYKYQNIVLNKILPDSRRKIKAAILKQGDNVSDSLITIKSDDSSIYPYLLLLLNSRAIELALRSVISNINLNHYRLFSLPIPAPTDLTMHLSQLLYNKCKKNQLDWEEASDILSSKIYGISINELKSLKEIFPDRERNLQLSA